MEVIYILFFINREPVGSCVRPSLPAKLTKTITLPPLVTKKNSSERGIKQKKTVKSSKILPKKGNEVLYTYKLHINLHVDIMLL